MKSEINKLEKYVSPEIDVTDVLVEQDILNNGSANTSLSDIDMSGEYW